MTVSPPTFPVSQMGFADYARRIGEALTVRAMIVPGFRSPPKADADRTIRRTTPPLVSVRIAGRELDDVVNDMIVGACAVNDAPERATDIWREVMLSHKPDWEPPETGLEGEPSW